MSKASSILVDGNCIVCDYEVAHYKRIAPTEFNIVNIAAPEFDAGKYGLTAKAVNDSLHVIAPDGAVYSGVLAFAHIWSRIPKYALLSRLIRLPGIYQLSLIGYRIFASYIRPLLPKRNH